MIELTQLEPVPDTKTQALKPLHQQLAQIYILKFIMSYINDSWKKSVENVYLEAKCPLPLISRIKELFTSYRRYVGIDDSWLESKVKLLCNQSTVE